MSNTTTKNTIPMSADAVPKVNKALRYTNLAICSVTAYFLLYFNHFVVSFGITQYSGCKMPFIYSPAFIIGIISMMLIIAGNGLYIYWLSVIPSVFAAIAGVLLLNSQIYLHSIGIYVLGWDLCLSLMNLYHILIIIGICLVFVSAFLSLVIATQIRQRDQWLLQNKCVWPGSALPEAGQMTVQHYNQTMPYQPNQQPYQPPPPPPVYPTQGQASYQIYPDPNAK